MSTLKARKSAKTEFVLVPAAPLPAAPLPAAPPTVVIGRLAGIDPTGAPLVEFSETLALAPVAALATASYADVPPGASVALLFLDGDCARPLVIGLVGRPARAAPAPDSVTVEAPRELVLQCGRASIILTRAGKVLIRGTYVSSRASGMQRITGASVQIN